jgi:hypothetical protein
MAEPDAACYYTIKYARNVRGEWDREIGEHEFGCFPPEAGGSAMQCHAHLTRHHTPTTVACCFEGDYCNTELDPPVANYDPNDIVVPFRGHLGLILGLGIPILIIILVLVLLCALFNLYRKGNTRKWSSDSEFRLDDSDIQSSNRKWIPKVLRPLLGVDEKSPFDNSEFSLPDSWNAVKDLTDLSSGSGSGIPHLVQRTVARQLTQGELVGQGRYGAVRKATFKNDLVAVKTFITTEEASWKNEAEIYNTPMLRHENILGFIASDIRGGSRTEMLLIMDYCPHGSLYDYLKRETPLSLQEAVSLAFTAIKGLEHLHDEIVGTQLEGTRGKPAIAHRDIKSKNILVKRPGVCAIADFGLAIKYSSDMQGPEIPKNRRVGTIRYMAPEVLDNTIKSHVFTAYKQVDMYAFGLVLWEITRRIQEEPMCYTSYHHFHNFHHPQSQLSVLSDGSSLSSGVSSGIGGVGEKGGSSGSSSATSPVPPPPPHAQVLSDDSGVSNGTDGSGGSGGGVPVGVLPAGPAGSRFHHYPGTGAHHRRLASTKAKKYLCPYEDVAPCDPAFDTMREIVCGQKHRPAIEEHWMEDGTITYVLARVMRECWKESPDSRLTASYVKKQLAKQMAKCNGSL